MKITHVLAAMALIGLSSPAWARTDEMMMHLDNAVTIGTVNLPAGDYEVKADESKKDVKFIKNDDVVADVQGHWVDLPSKAENDEAIIQGNHLIQVVFGGQSKAFTIG